MSLPSTPIQFGPARALVGLFHATGRPATVGALLCPPVSQTLMRTQRIYRQLATQLAERGIAALRFDYYGSGDSAGDSVELDWERCLADIATAAAELRERSGCREVIGFGAQLGGSLALAAAHRAGFSRLVLWDPILDGSAYVARLDTLQETLRCDPLHYAAPRRPEEVAGQWLGIPVSTRWRAQLEAWRAGPADIPSLILDSLPAEADHTWAPLQTAGARIEPMPHASDWLNLWRLEHAVLAPRLLNAAVAAMEQPA